MHKLEWYYPETYKRDKDLHVTFDETLRFAKHMGNVTALVSRCLGFIRRSSSEFNNIAALTALYRGYVVSRLEYASVVRCPQSDIYIIAIVVAHSAKIYKIFNILMNWCLSATRICFSISVALCF